ncbi:hypothetical protein AB0K18_35380 [Nonomuraea sp. NPDC049421]|uniref:hypothetical protein n=1 Tax=Nonomuraea sp. NPDC049421 TaxID=3155275 RepID=UPI00341ADDBD
MSAGTNPRRWAMPALIGYAFAQAPLMTGATAVLAVVAGGAAPVGIIIGIGRLVGALRRDHRSPRP